MALARSLMLWTCRYRPVVAGFIGPNGAGKTTTLRMLLGLVRPSGGSGQVFARPLDTPAGYLPRVGALIESPAFYRELSGERNLAVQAALGGHNMTRVPVVLERVGLADRGGDRYRTYSLGMKQRLGIAGALLGDPTLLILDEPTNGLDPAGIRDMRSLPLSCRERPDRTGLLTLVRRSSAGVRLAGRDRARTSGVPGTHSTAAAGPSTEPAANPAGPPSF